MTSMNRSEGRNVFLFDSSRPEEPLGGFIQNGSISIRNLFQIVDILIVIGKPPHAPYTIRHRGADKVLVISDDTLPTGAYEINSQGTGKISITSEIWAPRAFSRNVSGTDQDSFTDEVRKRDGGCVISGKINKRPNKSWSGFAAAHVFPLQYGDMFSTQLLEGRMDTAADLKDVKLNSVNNGLLMSADIHFDFDNYLFSINPDDNYKIISFDEDNNELDGRTLDLACRREGDPSRVSDQPLRFLANVRGEGEPCFEHDFPPGSDMV